MAIELGEARVVIDDLSGKWRKSLKQKLKRILRHHRVNATSSGFRTMSPKKMAGSKRAKRRKLPPLRSDWATLHNNPPKMNNATRQVDIRACFPSAPGQPTVQTVEAKDA